MPYYRRLGQFHNTLISFAYYYKDRKDYEVVIAEDAKNANYMNEHQDLELLVKEFSKLIDIKHFITQTKAYNPAPFFNEAANIAKGEFLVITNPECFHKSNILNGLDYSFKNNKNIYVVCSCLSVNAPLFIKRFEDYTFQTHMWYHHSTNRNSRYHFCSAMSKENYLKIGGFDEEFSQGVGCEDVAFREQIIEAGIPIVLRDDLLVHHINHQAYNDIPENKHLETRNKDVLRKRGYINKITI